MKIGTKSLLFGVHQGFIHPLFVLWGWKRLYGLPNWKELVCIIIHDWGYWGCGDMDGKEGDTHMYWAAEFISFDWLKYEFEPKNEYYWLCLLHSSSNAKRLEMKPSKLCWADKLGSAFMPPWLWVFLGTLTGEIKKIHGVYETQGKNPGNRPD